MMGSHGSRFRHVPHGERPLFLAKRDLEKAARPGGPWTDDLQILVARLPSDIFYPYYYYCDQLY